MGSPNYAGIVASAWIKLIYLSFTALNSDHRHRKHHHHYLNHRPHLHHYTKVVNYSFE